MGNYEDFLAHLSRRLMVSIEYTGRAGACLCVRVSVCVFTFSKINISETSGPIATKFYLKHHWVGGKDTLGFRPDRIMATDSSNMVIMGKMLRTR